MGFPWRSCLNIKEQYGDSGDQIRTSGFLFMAVRKLTWVSGA